MRSSLIDQLLSEKREPTVANIRENECIGCTKCIQACPVDAIIGSAKKMHSILTTDCIGCGLCVEPCPVDCIDLIPQEKNTYSEEKARLRHYASLERRTQDPIKKKVLSPNHSALKIKQDFIMQAVKRAEAKRIATK